LLKRILIFILLLPPDFQVFFVFFHHPVL
jgi:hypothetical protein